MNFLDKVKDVVAGNADKAGQVIDKAADLADKRTGGKHSTKIVGAAAKARDAVEKLERQQRSGRQDPGASSPPPPAGS